MEFMGKDISTLKGLIPLEIGGGNGMINVRIGHMHPARATAPVLQTDPR